MANVPLFHVGYHKTGTTWMQRRLFHPEFGYIQVLKDPSEVAGDNVSVHDNVSRLIVRPHRFAYDPGAVASEIAAGHTKSDLIPVISSEIMSGHPFWGGRESFDLAHRIHEAAPNAQIMLTIRAQIPEIASVYMQYVRRGGRLPMRDFYVGPRSVGYDCFDPIHFEYHHLVGLYQSLFGAQNVIVLTQELLARAPQEFVARLAAFTGNTSTSAMPSTDREGASETEAAVGILRRINYVQREAAGLDPIVNLGPLAKLAYRGVGWASRRPFVKKTVGAKRPVRDTAQALFGGTFAASNQELQRLCPDLDLTGYEL